MNPALLLIGGWIGRALALKVASLKRPLAAEVAALRERLEKLRAENDLLRARLERLDPFRRPRFEPWQRCAILWHRARYAMSIEATARAFVITQTTVMNWLKDVESGVARLVRTRRPMNALPDLVGEIARRLKREWPSWGSRRIAGILARLGLKSSRSSVQRLLRRPPVPRRPGVASRPGRPIVARRPGHVFVIDFTRVRLGFFRMVVVGTVLDLFSRKIMALDVTPQEPEAAFACRLLTNAIRRHGKMPRWVHPQRPMDLGVTLPAEALEAILVGARRRRRVSPGERRGRRARKTDLDRLRPRTNLQGSEGGVGGLCQGGSGSNRRWAAILPQGRREGVAQRRGCSFSLDPA